MGILAARLGVDPAVDLRPAVLVGAGAGALVAAQHAWVRAGSVAVHVETYGIDEAPLVYERLHAGKINGRAVILPNG